MSEEEVKDPIEISTIKGSMVSQDGRLVLLNCQARDGSEKELVIPTPAIRNLIANLQTLSTSAEIVMDTSDPISVPTVRFGEPEPTFFVTALGGTVSSDTGLIRLRAAQVNGPNFQISMQKEQSRVLYQLLLDLFAVDDQKPT